MRVQISAMHELQNKYVLLCMSKRAINDATLEILT